MRKILTTLMLLLTVAFLSLGQDVKPVNPINFKPLQSPSFSYMTLDSAVWIYKGSTYGWTRIPTKQDVRRISTGCLTSPVLTDNGNGTVTINQVRVNIYPTPDFMGNMITASVATATFTLTNGAEEYISVRYNNGVPVFFKETVGTAMNHSDNLPIFVVWRLGLVCHSLNFDSLGSGLANKAQSAMYHTDEYKLSSDGGLAISESLTPNPRTIIMSGGLVYTGAVPQDVSSFNSSIDQMTLAYHVGGVWNYTDNLVYNNTQYDNGTNLVVGNNNKFMVRWFYRSIGDVKQVFYVLGTTYYNNIADASLEQPRTDLPLIIRHHCLLVGRSIIEYNITSGVTQDLIKKTYAFSTVINHDDTGNKSLAGTGVTWGHINDQAQIIYGIKDFNSTPTSTTTPTTGNQLTNKNYVDTKDPSITNEGQLSTVGTTNNATIQSNTSGSNILNLRGAGINVVSASGNTITITATEVDGSITNEIQTLSTSSSGTTRTITISSGNSVAIDVADNDNSSTNEIQDLSGSGATLSGYQISLSSDATPVTLPNEVDGSITNEIQALTRTGDLIGLTQTSTTISIADKVSFTILDDAKDPTGFLDGSNINVSYDWTSRTVTLTGDLTYYWKGVKKILTSPWTSTAHAATQAKWFLYSTDGTNFTWSQSVWTFDFIQVAAVTYKATAAASIAIRETHGLMPWQSHQEAHDNIGTYLPTTGGGGLLTAGTFILNTATDAATTPGFDAFNIKDEDLLSSEVAWPEGTYTTMYIGAGNASVFNIAATFPFLSAGSFMQWNNTTNGTLNTSGNNSFYNVYEILVPVASSSNSQKYRVILLQPQVEYTSQSAAVSEVAAGLNLGELATYSPEFKIYGRITYGTNSGDANTGKCRIIAATYLLGSNSSVTNVPLVSNSHSNLSSPSLVWSASAHTGTNNTLAAFSTSGVAETLSKGDLVSGTASLTISNGTGRLVGGTSTITIDLSGYAPAFSGTPNYIPKFTGTGTTIGNSPIYTDGTNVGIGNISSQSNPNLYMWGWDGINTNSARSGSVMVGTDRSLSVGSWDKFKIYTNVASGSPATSGTLSAEFYGDASVKFYSTVNSTGYLLNNVNLLSSLSANTITKWDGTKFVSISNGTGYPFNDGSGGISWSYPEITSLRSTGSTIGQVATSNGSGGIEMKNPTLSVTSFIKSESATGIFNLAHSSVVYNDQLFIGERGANPKIVRFSNPDNLGTYTSTTVTGTGNSGSGLEYGYYVSSINKIVFHGRSQTSGTDLIELDPVAMTYIKHNFSTISGSFSTSATDGTYIYIANLSYIKKIRVSDWTEVLSVALPSNIQFPHAMAINVSRGEAYLTGSIADPIYMAKINTSDLSYTQINLSGYITKATDDMCFYDNGTANKVFIGGESFVSTEQYCGVVVETTNSNALSFIHIKPSYGLFIDGVKVYNCSLDGYIQTFSALDPDNVSTFLLEGYAPNEVLALSNGRTFLTHWNTTASTINEFYVPVPMPTPNALTNPMTTTGDIIYGNPSSTPARLPIGSSGQVLTVIGGSPSWQNAASGFTDPMTTRGDVIYRNSSNVTARLGLGSNGQLLGSNGTDLLWVNAPTGTSQWTTDTYGITYANNVGIGIASASGTKLFAEQNVNGGYTAKIRNTSSTGLGLFLETAGTTSSQPILLAQSTSINDIFRVNANGSIRMGLLPNADQSYVLGYNPATGDVSYLTKPSGSGGSGTVTSFSSGNLSPLFTTSVSNATTTPVLSFTVVSQAANTVYAAPNGSSGAPSFRKVVYGDVSATGIASEGTILGYSGGSFNWTNSLTSSNAAPIGYTFRAINTSSGWGINASSSSGSGVAASSDSGAAIQATSNTGVAGQFDIRPISTNTMETAIWINRRTNSGLGAIGIGSKISFSNVTTAGTFAGSNDAEFGSVLTNATSPLTRTAEFIWLLGTSGSSPSEKMRLLSAGTSTIGAVLKLTPLDDPPTGANASLGMIYVDTDTHIYFYNGTSWVRMDN